LVYVKKWLITSHALVLKLSNKVIQVNYQDGSELLMSTKHKKVSYLNAKGERVTYLISTALLSDNKELIKRLNYARQVLEYSLKRDGGERASLGTAR